MKALTSGVSQFAVDIAVRIGAHQAAAIRKKVARKAAEAISIGDVESPAKRVDGSASGVPHEEAGRTVGALSAQIELDAVGVSRCRQAHAVA